MYVSAVRLKFTPNFKLIAFCVVFLPVLITLGFWQLDRADEKQALKEKFTSRTQAPVVDYYTLKQQLSGTQSDGQVGTDLDYVHVRFAGNFIAGAQWLLENKIFHGRPGYHVLNLFQLTDGNFILVNRGWIEAESHRDNLPTTSFPTGEVTLTGILKSPGENRMLTYQPELIAAQKVIATLDLEKMGAEFDRSILPYVFYSEQNSPVTYIEQWPVIATQPEKHTGYAVQWFGMAIALCVLTFFANSNFSSWLADKRKGISS